jgi:CheY-like chemotaxis protein
MIKTILYVDDNPVSIIGMKKTIELLNEGLEVPLTLETITGKDAYEKAASKFQDPEHKPFDLVILDGNLGPTEGKNGPDLAKILVETNYPGSVLTYTDDSKKKSEFDQILGGNKKMVYGHISAKPLLAIPLRTELIKFIVAFDNKKSDHVSLSLFNQQGDKAKVESSSLVNKNAESEGPNL